MKPENAEKLGVLADSLDAVLYSAKLPLPPATHLQALTETIRKARDHLVEVVKDETGADPWEDNSLEG
ncbi:hypothetical protein ASG50_25480 [Rhizobium sp. Leaf386]|nr:hypothetical protein ASG50_25480 [Rhizobium sp. Leaf386]